MEDIGSLHTVENTLDNKHEKTDELSTSFRFYYIFHHIVECIDRYCLASSTLFISRQVAKHVEHFYLKPSGG